MIPLVRHELQDAWNLAGAAVKANALSVALERQLFEWLTRPRSLVFICNQLKVNPMAAEPWLELLWSMGYLKKTQHNEYVVSSMTAKYLLIDAELSCAQSVCFRLNNLKHFSQQFDQLLDGKETTRDPKSLSQAWAQAARAQILEEQRAVTVPAFERLMDRLSERYIDASVAMRWLDIGAGAGLISIASMQRFPKASGVVYDQPPTADVAQTHIRTAGLDHRLSVQSGDLNTDFPDGKFDLVWCSSVIHFLDDYRRFIERLSLHLSSHGIAVLVHAEQNDSVSESEKVLPFYSPMMMKGNILPKRSELMLVFHQAGLECIHTQQLNDFPMAPVWVHVCRRMEL